MRCASTTIAIAGWVMFAALLWPWGYAELLAAIKDPRHERHAELTEWIGDHIDPNANEAEWLTAEVAALARSWCRKSVSKRARRR
jgi:Plasmid pRiA4b ORF-3-like protein